MKTFFQFGANEMVTSSVVVPHVLVTDHRSRYVEPGLPENKVVAREGLSKDPPVPERTVQLPFPESGTFAVRVVLDPDNCS
jgi:hypothetical protein